MVVDTTSPSAPVVGHPTTGTSIMTNTLTFTGTGEPGASISIIDGNGTVIY